MYRNPSVSGTPEMLGISKRTGGMTLEVLEHAQKLSPLVRTLVESF